MKEFKDKLKERRCAEGLSQQQLADKLFVSRSAVAKWENGLGFPSPDCREQIRSLFGVDDSFFAADEPEEILCTKNRKLRKLSIVLRVLAGTFAVVVIALTILLGSGYRFSAAEIFSEHSASVPALQFADGEYVFDSILWDVTDGEGKTIDHMMDAIRVDRKTGPFYREATGNAEYCSQYVLVTTDIQEMAYLEVYHGRDADYYFLKWINQLGTDKPTDSEMQTKFPLLTDRITVNGQEKQLLYYSYFKMSEAIDTLEADGTELILMPYTDPEE